MHSSRKPNKTTKTTPDSDKNVAEAKTILLQAGIQKQKLVDDVLTHKFPHLVAQGLLLLVRHEYASLEALEAEPACIYRELLLRVFTPPGSKRGQELSLAHLILEYEEYTDPSKRGPACADLLKKILDFLATKKSDPSQLYEASRIVACFLEIIKKSHPDAREFTINFFEESEDWIEDHLFLTLFDRLKIPYTKENLGFLRAKIPLNPQGFYKITRFLHLLSSNTLLTHEIFTTLVNQASTFKAIQEKILRRGSPLFTLIYLTDRIINLSKNLPWESTKFNTKNLELFLNSSKEEIQSSIAIFQNLQLLRNSPEPTEGSAAGIANVLHCVVNKKNIKKLDSTIHYLVQPSLEGQASPEAIRTTLCSLPTLETMVEIFSRLCKPNKALLKAIIIQNKRDLLHKELLALGRFQTLFESEYQLKTADDSFPPELNALITLETALCQHVAPDQLVTAFEIFFTRIHPPIKSTYIPLFLQCSSEENPQQFLENYARQMKRTQHPLPTTAPARLKAPLAELALYDAEQLLEAHGLLTEEKKEALNLLFQQGEDTLKEAQLTIVCTPESRIQFDTQSEKEGTSKAALLWATETLAAMDMALIGLELKDKRAIMSQGLASGKWITTKILKILVDALSASCTMQAGAKWQYPRMYQTWGKLILLEPKKTKLFYIFKKLQTSALPIATQWRIMQMSVERTNKNLDPIHLATQFFLGLIYGEECSKPIFVQEWIQSRKPRDVFLFLLTSHAAKKGGNADKKTFETLIAPPPPVIPSATKICQNAGLSDPSLLAKIGAHQHPIMAAKAVVALHTAGLLSPPLDATCGADGTLKQESYLNLILHEDPPSAKNGNLVQMIAGLGKAGLLNETVLNFLVVQQQQLDPSSLDVAVLLIDNFHLCNIPLTKANLEFSQLPLPTPGEKIATLCNQLAQHKLLTPNSFLLLILQEDQRLTTAESSHRLNDQYATLLSQSVKKLETQADLSSLPLSEPKNGMLTLFLDLLKMDVLNQPLWDKIEAEDPVLLTSIHMLKKKDLLLSWAIKTITTNVNASIDSITEALVQLKQGGVPVGDIQHNFAALLTTQKTPILWVQKIVVFYQCGYIDPTEIFQQIEALGKESRRSKAIEILYSVRTLLKYKVKRNGLTQLLDHANPLLLAKVLVLTLYSKDKTPENANGILDKLLRSENLRLLQKSMKKVRSIYTYQSCRTTLCRLLIEHAKPDELAAVFVRFYEEHSEYEHEHKLSVCEKYASEIDPLAAYQAACRAAPKKDTTQGYGAFFLPSTISEGTHPKKRVKPPSEKAGARKKKRKRVEEAAKTPSTRGTAAIVSTVPADATESSSEDDNATDDETVLDTQSIRGSRPRSPDGGEASDDGMECDESASISEEEVVVVHQMAWRR